MKTSDDLDAEALLSAIEAGVTVEDLARARASIDGKRDEFDAGRGVSVFDDATGHYERYRVEAREMVHRATKYAKARLTAANSEHIGNSDDE